MFRKFKTAWLLLLAAAALQKIQCTHALMPKQVTSNRSDWMANLKYDLTNWKLTDLAIPGSHDSGSYLLFVNHSMDTYDQFSKYFKSIALNSSDSHLLNEVIYRWAKTQDLDITAQLERGVRYLDLRVAEDENGVYRIIHRLVGLKIKDIFNQIESFAKLHPKEIILIDFRLTSIQANTSVRQAQNKTVTLLQDIFKSKICPNYVIDKLTIRFLWKQKCQILIFYNNLQIRNTSSFIVSNRMINSPFNEKVFQQKSKWLKFLNRQYQMKRNNEKFYVTQGIMQPHWITIAMAGLSKNATLRNWISDEATLGITKWLKGKQAGENGINIVMADFVETHEFIDNVLSLNVLSSDEDNLYITNILFVFCIPVFFTIQTY